MRVGRSHRWVTYALNHCSRQQMSARRECAWVAGGVANDVPKMSDSSDITEPEKPARSYGSNSSSNS